MKISDLWCNSFQSDLEFRYIIGHGFLGKRVKKFPYFIRLTTRTRVKNNHNNVLEQDKTNNFTKETI